MGLLKNLFGGSKEPVKAAPPKVDVQASIQNLSEQTEKIEKRQKVLEVKMNDLKKSAIEKKQKGNTKGALMDMKQMKMREKEIAKLDGQMLVLQEQQMMIEGANNDQSVVNAMKQGAGAIKELNKQADVDDIAELQDELADMKADADERGEFFANMAQEGNDELLDELNELEAYAVEEEMGNMNINNNFIPQANPIVPMQ